MNKRLGAIAVAACVCGLLFTGAASARQTADTITVTGAVLGPATNGTYVQFFSGNSAPYGNGSPFKQISLSGGSNFHFSWTGVGAPCKLTPSNGGVSCDFTSFPGGAPNFWVNTIISGTLPTAVTGTVVYADNSTGTFIAPVTEGPPATYGGSIGAVVKRSTIQISVGSALLALPPILRFSLSGGSNSHVTAISSSGGGNCSLTSDGGGSCAFAPPASNFVLNATFSGRPPNFMHGQIGYAHNVTMGWAYAVSCHCTKLNTEATGFRTQDQGQKLVFSLKWKLNCTAGSSRGFTNDCLGAISINRPRLPHGLQLRQADGKPWAGGKLTIRCRKQGSCARTTSGETKLELIGPAAVRAREAITFHMRLRCGNSKAYSQQELTLRFDKRGNLDREKSHLGQLG